MQKTFMHVSRYLVMSNLASVQADFQDYIISPNYDNFEKIKQNMLRHTNNQFGLDAESRLEIYYDMYRLRMLDVLFADYPKLVGIMGEEQFTRAFLHYLINYPSTHYSVRPFGEKLSHFLTQFEPFCFTKYYAEMAKFEWALSLTYDAGDAEHLSFDKLTSLPPEDWVDLKFKLQPAVNLLTFEYNIVETWQILDAQKILPEQEDESVLETYTEENPEKLITALPCPQTWLIWRKDLMARFQELNSEQYFMLEAINQGLTFSEVCEKLTAIMPEENVPGFVVHHLAEWLEMDVLTTHISSRTMF